MARSTTLRPKALRPGDVVAVAALSGGLDADEEAVLGRGVAELEALGFAVHVSSLVDTDRGWWWSAARPAEIADELNRLLRDPAIRAIFALTGGRTALGYLDRIDYDAVRADPKPIVGFSDIDVLHLALFSRTGLSCVHADLVTQGLGDWHADEPRRKELADVYAAVLTGAAPAGPLPQGRPWERWRPGRAEGVLIGGLLNRLVRIQSTPYALDLGRFDGAILFWEEFMTNHAGVWTDLQALRLAGVLDRIAGMVVGVPTEVEPTEGGPETLREIALDVLGDRDIPVLGNAEIGHQPPNVPLPLGIRAELDADAVTLSLLELATA
jgi:muramoyltetrapeptide carboxypeptidase